MDLNKGTKILEVLALFFAIVLVVFGVAVLTKNKNGVTQNEASIASATATTKINYPTNQISDHPNEADEEYNNQKNLTISLAEEFAQQVVDTGIEPNNAPDLLESLIQSQEGQRGNLFKPKSINDADIKIVENNTENDKRYLSNISTILLTHFPESKFKKLDIDVASEAIDNRNFKQLDNYIDAYQTLYNRISTTEVTPNWLELHKQQLELFDVTLQLLEAYRGIDTDPVKTAAAVEKYPEILENAYILAIAIRQKVRSQSEF